MIFIEKSVKFHRSFTPPSSSCNPKASLRSHSVNGNDRQYRDGSTRGFFESKQNLFLGLKPKNKTPRFKPPQKKRSTRGRSSCLCRIVDCINGLFKCKKNQQASVVFPPSATKLGYVSEILISK